MERSATSMTPNERLEALKARYVSTLDNQNQLGDIDINKIMDRDLYEATKNGNVEEFIDALEAVSESRKLALSLIFDQVTPSGNSLLHVATSFGSDGVIELILYHFPHTMTQKNSSEDTLLHVAVQDRRFNTVKMLIHRGTDSEIIYRKNKNNKSPLYLAIEKCNRIEWKCRKGAGWEIFQLLLEAFARDEDYAVKIQGKSPILAAIKRSHLELLREIIDRLPKLLHLGDENGWTPLHAAASDGRYWAVSLLLQKCPYLALQTDKNGSYPIHIACEGWSYFTISELMEKTWPDLAEIKNKKGQNILHVAAKAGNRFGVYRILDKRGDETDTEKLVNAKDVDGNTPLHLASMHNRCEVMRYLTKDKRIDLELRNNDGLTALDVAMESESLSTENPPLIGRAILIVAGVPQSKGQDILSPRDQCSGGSKSSSTEWIKDQVNILLIVATLAASVTFTAGVTLPGGYNASSDLHPGMATMLHYRMFQVFVIANMLAMYSSVLAVVVLVWGLNRDFYITELAFHLAGPLLLMAIMGMSVAFFAAVTVAVSKLTWLGNLVLYVGVLYLVMVVVVLAALIFSSSKPTMHIMVFHYIVISASRNLFNVLVYYFIRN